MNAPAIRISFDADVGEVRRRSLTERCAALHKDTDLPDLGVIVQADGMQVCMKNSPQALSISICFHRGGARHRRLYGGGRSQHLMRALGLDRNRHLTIVDATAGLASDSFVIACQGGTVHMIERSPLLALMIEDALAVGRAHGEPALNEILGRMSLTQDDALKWLVSQPEKSQDVIYLDPMFPERRKHAASKKEMQFLQQLFAGESYSDSADRDAADAALLALALEKARYRVTVKRPRRAPTLLGPEPGHSIQGKTTRFDIYPLARISSQEIERE